MNPAEIVSSRVIEDYARDGVVLLERPFEQHWIDGLLEEFQRIVRDYEAGSQEYPVRRVNGTLGIQNVVLRNAYYRRWAIESPVAEIVGRVIQSKSIRFYFDNFFCKEGDSPEQATPIHHDVAAFGFKGVQLPSCWLALSDVDTDNAPLVAYPGSHKDISVMYRSILQKPGLPLLPGYREHDEIGSYLERGGFERRVFPARKGDVIMLNPYTIHGSLARTAGPKGMRIGFSTRWFGDDVRWQPSVYCAVEASSHPREIPAGDAPPSDLFPIVWDAEEGNVARRTGLFTTHITLEPKKGFHSRY
jgi:ectoine hydroxylase-related dioxygenase (phytanoyl-CoA dioxygenase family)